MSADTASPDQFWCGRCGDGPMSERGLAIHNGRVHVDECDVVSWTCPPNDAALVGEFIFGGGA